MNKAFKANEKVLAEQKKKKMRKKLGRNQETRMRKRQHRGESNRWERYEEVQDVTKKEVRNR